MREREELIRVCHLVAEKGFVSATDGNLSMRMDNDNYLITPSGKNKGELSPDDLLEIDNMGEIVNGNGKVTTEVKIHLVAYQKRAEVNSVIHCHPVFATAFASCGRSMDIPVFPEVVLSLGRIPTCSYATPSTEMVSESMLPYLEYVWSMLMANHGAVTFGKNPYDAYKKMDKLEHTAKTLSVIYSIGEPTLLSRKELDDLYSIAASTYGMKLDERNKF